MPEARAANGKSKMEPSQALRITTTTLIPLGAVFALVFTLLAGYRWLDAQFDDMREVIIELRHEIQTLRKGQEDRWRGSDMKLWCEMLERMNPDHVGKIPDPWNILDKRRSRGR